METTSENTASVEHQDVKDILIEQNEILTSIRHELIIQRKITQRLRWLHALAGVLKYAVIIGGIVYSVWMVRAFLLGIQEALPDIPEISIPNIPLM